MNHDPQYIVKGVTSEHFAVVGTCYDNSHYYKPDACHYLVGDRTYNLGRDAGGFDSNCMNNSQIKNVSALLDHFSQYYPYDHDKTLSNVQCDNGSYNYDRVIKVNRPDHKERLVTSAYRYVDTPKYIRTSKGF